MEPLTDPPQVEPAGSNIVGACHAISTGALVAEDDRLVAWDHRMNAATDGRGFDSPFRRGGDPRLPQLDVDRPEIIPPGELPPSESEAPEIIHQERLRLIRIISLPPVQRSDTGMVSQPTLDPIDHRLLRRKRDRTLTARGKVKERSQGQAGH